MTALNQTVPAAGYGNVSGAPAPTASGKSGSGGNQNDAIGLSAGRNVVCALIMGVMVGVVALLA